MTKMAMGMVVGMGFAVLGGCASGVVEQRGSIVMTRDSVKALAVGPSVIHAFSMDAGGRLFVAQVKAGTDADCAGAAARGATPLAVNRRNAVMLAPGQVACVATERSRYEVMWHARAAESPSGTVLVAQERR